MQLEINLSSSEVSKLTMNLVQVAQGYVAVKANQSNTKSGSCNINVDCQRSEWGNEIRSVARYVISGAYLCTGTLVNNIREDREPLFLTAAHCKVSEISAPSMVFYWNYEASVCEGVADGLLDQKQTGATLVSRWEGVQENVLSNSDFALVRLDDAPANSANVFYAGWDNQDNTHVGSSTIHHPSGHEKRISKDIDEQTITHFGSDIIDDGRFLRIQEWEEGTTEGGSSGAGLWNSNKYLIGTLSGGDASCVDTSLSDWYGRFSSHWLGNNYKSNQLAAHLAPNSSSTTTLDGTDSCSAPTVSIIVSNNIPLVGEQISFISSVSGGSGGYTYDWDFGDDNTSPDANPLHAYSMASSNEVRLVVRDSSQCPSIARTMVLAPDVTEAFLSDGLLPSEFEQTPSAKGSWTVDNSRSSEGLFSLKSQIINGNESSSIELNGDYDALIISFDYRVSSEDGFDFFKFYIDDIEEINVSGELDWTTVHFLVAAGSHQFRWEFAKSELNSTGQDTSWIDNLKLLDSNTNNPPTVVTAIVDQTNTEGDVASLDIFTSFEDADGHILSFAIADGPASLVINSVTGIISGTLMNADVAASPYTVSVTVSDGLASIILTFSWTVNAFPPPPPSSSGGTSGIAILGLLFLSFSFRRKG